MPDDEHSYWLPDSGGTFGGLQQMGPAEMKLEARTVSEGRIDVRIQNPSGNPLAFFSEAWARGWNDEEEDSSGLLQR
jgi:hypothetical protein